MATVPYRESEEQQGPNLFAALPAILWQRRWLIIAPAVLAAIGGTAAAFLIPKVYESSATVLIESQQVATDNDQATIADLIDERIARAKERVLSRQVLIQLIRSNNLYPKEQQSGAPFSTIVDQMRDSTLISGVASEASGLRAMMGSKQTIALRIAFDYPDPVKAQAITQQFVNRFLEVDASAQQSKATGAATSLEQQASDLQNQIAAVQNKITKIKSENGAVLAMTAGSTGNPLADASRIDADIANLQSENTKLAAQLGASGGDSQVAQAEANYRALRSRYSDTHPDVIAAKATLEAIRAASQSSGNNAGNLVQAQIAANRSQIASLQSARGMVLSQSANAQAALARGPAIQAQVDQLEKQAEVLRDQYRLIGTRSASAQLSARMESEQKGERLTLADPPIVPDVPIKPKRKVLIGGGLAAGLGFGLALALLFELLLRPIRGVEAVRAATGFAPLAIVPDYGRKPHMLIRWLEKRNRGRSGKGG
ncbi:GumC family protein [Sphingomonas bacterium]|uniref:GumC family protein n=1 Tax=Sphingomonas bacterium TaxID=1895847 RepID=UPI0015752507|nr:Wzz/FepE/Etk N-terminal domain-containing protein [Sphingomonas bacterium]